MLGRDVCGVCGRLRVANSRSRGPLSRPDSLAIRYPNWKILSKDKTLFIFFANLTEHHAAY